MPAETRRHILCRARLTLRELAVPGPGGHPPGQRSRGPHRENEVVRRLLQGISRAHGRAQRQAKPLTAEGPGRGEGHGQRAYFDDRPIRF